MTLDTLQKRPSAFLPLAMSAAALALVVGFLALFGGVRHPDEGATARVFQLLLVAQVPIVGLVAVTWLPRAPRQALVVLALQLAAGVAALAPVVILER
jgi:cytochrome bd-type quinol oxidase subunit 2